MKPLVIRHDGTDKLRSPVVSCRLWSTCSNHDVTVGGGSTDRRQHEEPLKIHYVDCPVLQPGRGEHNPVDFGSCTGRSV